MRPIDSPVYQESERISLNCKSLGEEKTPRDFPILNQRRLDLDSDEQSSEQVQYLLLGEAKTKKYSTAIGLVAISVMPGLFRRIGYFEFGGLKMWDGAERQDIVLV
jgi:hypothetical protein